MFKVYYQGQYKKTFTVRDDAMDYVMKNGLQDDYEILDKSDSAF